MNSRALFLLYFVVIGGSGFLLLYPYTTPQNLNTLGEAKFYQAENNNALAPRTVSLPHDWRGEDISGRTGSYAVTFDGNQVSNDTELAILIRTVRLNLEIFLNGSRIGDGGSMGTPVGRNMRRPLMFVLPKNLVTPGLNTIRINIKTGPDEIGYLSAMYIDNVIQVRQAYERALFIRITLVKAITASVFFISGLIALIALIRSEDREYKWFFIGTFIWGLHSFSYFVVNIPFSDRIWDWFNFATLWGFSYIGGVIYIHRYLGIERTKIEYLANTLAVLLPLAILFLPDSLFYPVSYYFWHPLCQAVGTYGFLKMVSRSFDRGATEFHIIFASGFVLFGCSVHDLCLVLGLLDWGRGFIIHYSMLLVIVVFFIVLIRRFSASLQALEEMTNVLESRVEERRQELEKTYEKLREQEKRRVLAEEHDRIMRDMHDGVGGQLISALTLARKDDANPRDIEQSLQTALNDLRLTIDSLDEDVSDVTGLLAMFRSRIEPSLEARNIALNWQVEELAPLASFSSRQALNLLRVCQEFITNVLKHSDASRVSIVAHDIVQNNEKQILIKLTENGHGFDATQSNGRGLLNMQRRSEELSGNFTFGNGKLGTSLELKLKR